MKNIPKHVIIIPDGNRRWARERGFKETKGHERSTEFKRVISLLDEAMNLGIEYFSLWGFSTENWNRREVERQIIFNLVFKLVERLKPYSREKGIRFRHIGRSDRLPKNLIEVMRELEKETKNNNKLNVQLFLDYGGRDEIVRAVNKILRDINKNIDENSFINYLDTAEIPDPDMIIRTGGEKRLSGLMSYQSAYSELYFTDLYFPDFNASELKKAVDWFSNKQRRFGGD